MNWVGLLGGEGCFAGGGALLLASRGEIKKEFFLFLATPSFFFLSPANQLSHFVLASKRSLGKMLELVRTFLLFTCIY